MTAKISTLDKVELSSAFIIISNVTIFKAMEKQPTPINQGKREAMCLQPKQFHQCLWPERKLTEWGGLLGGAQNRSGWLQVLLAWHVMTLVGPFRNQSVMHETVHVSLKSYCNSTKQNTVGFR